MPNAMRDGRGSRGGRCVQATAWRGRARTSELWLWVAAVNITGRGSVLRDAGADLMRNFLVVSLFTFLTTLELSVDHLVGCLLDPTSAPARASPRPRPPPPPIDSHPATARPGPAFALSNPLAPP